MLEQDPRSVHMRRKFSTEVEMGFCIDRLNVRYRVADGCATVTRIELWARNYEETDEYERGRQAQSAEEQGGL